MTITKYQNGASLTIALEGRLDTMTAPELDKELKACLDSIDTLEFDFGKLDYISSAGLRVLLEAQRRMQGKGGMKIVHASEIVKEVFEVTGLMEILSVE